jgi:transposase InsO family protein
MQVFGLPSHVIRSGRAASRLLDAKTPTIAAARRRDALARWRGAMAKGLSAADAAEAVGVPRSTLYRWREQPEPRSRRPRRLRARTWSPALLAAAEALRLDHPMWGRAKLGPLLRREGFAVSDATVGRIIAHLVARGVVEAVPTLRRRKGGAARAWRRKHATRLPKGHKAQEPGELVQVDTLSINLRPDKTIKQFTAYDPVARHTAAQAFSRATATCAASFLDKLIAAMPFTVSGIQVDGGSEFMAAFEEACQAKNLALFVLPPKRPDLNGAVERAQGSWRYEFYACHDLPLRLDRLNQRIDAFAHLYNHHRPHGALGGMTPAQYLSSRSSRDPPQSHMC